MADIILASASPRRRELLALAGVDFAVKVADVEEVIPENASPDEVVKSLAIQKASAVAQENPDSIVIGSDTVVALDGVILGKPRDEEDAVRMLKTLSGRSHTVYTGVAIIHGEKISNFCEATEVVFNSLTDEEIRNYVATKNLWIRPELTASRVRAVCSLKKSSAITSTLSASQWREFTES